MRPRDPGKGVVQVQGDVEPLDVSWQAAFISHDTDMTVQLPLDAVKGGISKELAHLTVVSFGRGSAPDAVIGLAGKRNVAMP